jgi:hypothetical protein
VQSTKLELLINLQTAKALWIDIPPTLLTAPPRTQSNRHTACERAGGSPGPSAQQVILRRAKASNRVAQQDGPSASRAGSSEVRLPIPESAR